VADLRERAEAEIAKAEEKAQADAAAREAAIHSDPVLGGVLADGGPNTNGNGPSGGGTAAPAGLAEATAADLGGAPMGAELKALTDDIDGSPEMAAVMAETAAGGGDPPDTSHLNAAG
jgi:hypothetical protein